MDVWPCKLLSPAESNRRQLITHGKPAVLAVAVPCSTPFFQLNYSALKSNVHVCSAPSPYASKLTQAVACGIRQDRRTGPDGLSAFTGAMRRLRQ